MMKSQTLEFIQEMNECMAQVVDHDSNTTEDHTLSHLSCNETMTAKIDMYVKPLLEQDFPMAVIYCCIVGVALLVGTFGNIMILIVTAGTRTMNRIGRDFVMNLALADLCVAAVADPMCIIGVVKGERWFQGKWILCEVVASMCLTACFCAFLSLTMMSVNRYVFVCRNALYRKIFKRPVCIGLCLFCWISAFLFEFPNFLGWGDHYFDKKSLQCIWDRTKSFSYTVFVSAGLIGGPLVLMGVCFILVFRKIWLTKKNVFSLNPDDPLRMRRAWTEALRSSRTLVIIFLAFVVCWTPYAVVTALDVTNSFSYKVHLYVTLLAHLHSSLNFTIYMLSNKNFRQTVFALFHCRFMSLMYRSSMDTDKTESTTRTDKSVDDYTKTYYINTSMHFKDDIPNKLKSQMKENQFHGIKDGDDNHPKQDILTRY